MAPHKNTFVHVLKRERDSKNIICMIFELTEQLRTSDWNKRKKEKVAQGFPMEQFKISRYIAQSWQCDWASPVVVVPKSNGKLWLCGDYKVIYQCRNGRPAVYFTLGGRHFHEVDLSQAYAQVKDEEKSQKYLTINTIKGLYGVRNQDSATTVSINNGSDSPGNSRCMLHRWYGSDGKMRQRAFISDKIGAGEVV